MTEETKTETTEKNSEDLAEGTLLSHLVELRGSRENRLTGY